MWTRIVDDPHDWLEPISRLARDSIREEGSLVRIVECKPDAGLRTYHQAQNQHRSALSTS